MALSGVNQSHVQPVWAEIPSRSADIGARAVSSTRPLAEDLSKGVLYQLGWKWAEIPSRSADIGARTVSSTRPLAEDPTKGVLCQLGCRLVIDDGEGDRSNLSALPAQNLLADPVNSRVPSPDIQLEMGIFCSAACIANGLHSI